MEKGKRLQKERVSLTIAGVELNLVTEESEEYMKRLASDIDRRVSEMVVGNTRISKIDAALFCALDYLDALNKRGAALASEHDRAEKFYRELCLLKQENAELKTLLGGCGSDGDAEGDCGNNGDDCNVGNDTGNGIVRTADDVDENAELVKR